MPAIETIGRAGTWADPSRSWHVKRALAALHLEWKVAGRAWEWSLGGIFYDAHRVVVFIGNDEVQMPISIEVSDCHTSTAGTGVDFFEAYEGAIPIVSQHERRTAPCDLTDPLIFGLRREHDPVTWTDCSVPNYPSQERKQISD